MTSFVTSVINSQNPFVKLVGSVTADDGSGVVTAHDQEKIVDASHQSDFALEWIHTALTERLDHRSHHVRYKALVIIRILLLEGPAAFSSRMGRSLQRMHELAHREYSDMNPSKQSIEYGVRSLADAIHQCCSGAGVSVLQNWSAAGSSSSSSSSGGLAAGGAAGGADASSAGRFRSAFHQEQMKEMAKWRKKQQESTGSNVVISADKNLLTFKAELTAQKLVESVLNAEKKKFAPEETFAFADAVMGNAKPADVCSIMDKVIAEPRYSIAQRHKMLQMVEGLVMTQGVNEATGAPSEVGFWWRAHTANLSKVAVMEAVENPAKAQQMQQMAKRIIEHLVGGMEAVGNVGGTGGGGGGAAASAATATTHGGNFGAASSAAPFSFGPAATTAAAAAPVAFSTAINNSNAQQQQQQQQQQQAQQRSRGSSVTQSFTPTFGMTNINPAFAMDSGAAANAAGANMFGSMTVKKPQSSSSAAGGGGAAPPQTADIFAVPAAPAAVNNNNINNTDMLKSLQEQLARNMEMMAQLTRQQQSQQQQTASLPSSSQQPQQQQQQQQAAGGGAWGSSMLAPPPIINFIDPQPAPSISIVPAIVTPSLSTAPLPTYPPAAPFVSTNNTNSVTTGAEECLSASDGYNNSFGGAGVGSTSISESVGAESAGSSYLLAPNNSMTESSALLIAQMAAMQHEQQQQQQRQQLQQQFSQPPPSFSLSSSSPAHCSVPVAQPQPVLQQQQQQQQQFQRSREDDMLITVLQQQLKSAQDQITAQNQMISMMQQQIQMLMTQKLFASPPAAAVVASRPAKASSRESSQRLSDHELRAREEDVGAPAETEQADEL